MGDGASAPAGRSTRERVLIGELNEGRTHRSRRLYYATKRLLDLAIAVPALLLATPLLAVAWVLIRLGSPGPGIFTQERVGARRVKVDGSWMWELRPFTCYKLRTMAADATTDNHQAYMAGFIANDSQAMAEAQHDGNGDGTYRIANDERITRVGRLLRRSGLDELPQLWNVIRGDMAVVGPRPPITYEVSMYEPRHLERLAAKPGLTGMWQVQGRLLVDFDAMVDLDREYNSTSNTWLDLKLITLTLPALILGRGLGRRSAGDASDANAEVIVDLTLKGPQETLSDVTSDTSAKDAQEAL